MCNKNKQHYFEVPDVVGVSSPGLWAQAASRMLSTVEDDNKRGSLRCIFDDLVDDIAKQRNMSMTHVERAAYERLIDVMFGAGLLVMNVDNSVVARDGVGG